MWNLEGLQIKGRYMDEIPVTGRVELSRVQFGGGVSHHVILDSPITAYGAARNRVILNHKEIEQVKS